MVSSFYDVSEPSELTDCEVHIIGGTESHETDDVEPIHTDSNAFNYYNTADTYQNAVYSNVITSNTEDTAQVFD